jgi:hypothetical protein
MAASGRRTGKGVGCDAFSAARSGGWGTEAQAQLVCNLLQQRPERLREGQGTAGSFLVLWTTGSEVPSGVSLLQQQLSAS